MRLGVQSRLGRADPLSPPHPAGLGVGGPLDRCRQCLALATPLLARPE